MANRKFSRKMNHCNDKVKKGQIVANLEKFHLYADARGYHLQERTYGFYRVKHNGKCSILECCRASFTAVNEQGEQVLVKGWIINIAHRQRTFKPEGSGWDVFPVKE